MTRGVAAKTPARGQGENCVCCPGEAAMRASDFEFPRKILIVEDNPYGLLWFDRPAPHAMRSVETDGIVYLGSFSKTLAPGFRIGWALAPHGIREKLVLAAESAILSPSVAIHCSGQP